MENREGREGGFDGKTYLHIPTNPADTGSEPFEGTDFWVSPDIVVIPPGGAPGDKAVAGEENEIRVTVRNHGGIEAIDAFVEAYVNEPSTVMTPTTSIRLGGNFLSVPGYGSASTSFSWAPQDSDAGHRCLIARVALTVPADTYRDPNAFDVINDRHVAQRNIHVVAMAEAMREGFDFAVLNPGWEEERMLVRVEQIFDPEAFGQLGAAMGCRYGQPAEQRLDLGLVWDGEETGPAIELDLQPGESQRMALRVSPQGEVPEGGLSAIRIAQEDSRGTVLGGLTVVLRA